MPQTKQQTFKILSNIQYKHIGNCQRCRLALTRTKIVFGAGNPMADLIIVGEGPGADEDEQGIPFVGKSGKLLDRILATIGRDRSSVYICNTVKCRACEVESWGKKNRPPQPDEMLACSDFFDEQMNALPNKKLILAFGATAANRVLGRFEDPYPIFKMRFKYLSSGFIEQERSEVESATPWSPQLNRVPLVVTYHPSYLLRSPEEKIKTFNDVLFAKKYLDAPEEEKELFSRDSPEDPPKREVYAKVADTRKYGYVKPFQKDRYSETLEAL